MPIRMQRFITGRNAPADDTKVLFVAPVWTRETLRSVHLDARIITRGAGFGGVTGTASSYPDQPPEVNWHILFVPWHIWITHHGSADASGRHPADAVSEVAGANEIDRLFKNLLFSWESTGSEYYGHSDADADPQDFTQRHESESGTVTGDTADTAPAARGALEALGIVRLFGREVWMDAYTSDGDGKTRFTDSVEARFDAPLMGPGFVIGGVARYNMQGESNFNAEITNANRRYARDILISGDRTRVEPAVLHDAEAPRTLRHQHASVRQEGEAPRMFQSAGDLHQADTVLRGIVDTEGFGHRLGSDGAHHRNRRDERRRQGCGGAEPRAAGRSSGGGCCPSGLGRHRRPT